ncbi:alcohol dehydrogenase class IV [Litorivivens lipolytica]|uniref:Alcohol dehydrogenase class IV n=1 Tax=Litorivivens lipolytica TaxID=1524264 RepID=A0A7W4W1K6_9GAMM|nr:iron-containing alcohol dehydrogenase [Litorivivens lipolytica]MBB3045791.1 alcohol dehydrogenase class IV [Litorivivens lipolytica]
MDSTLLLPRILRVSAGARKEVGDVLKSLGLSRPFLVIDEFLKQQGHAEALASSLAEQGMTLREFSGVVPDPTTESIDAGLAALNEGDHDAIIALGGGSAIDTAKFIAVMAARTGKLRDYKVPATLDDGLPVIAIPSTAGTGSEATRAAVATDSETQEKMLCMGLGLMPVAALVDYELSMTMPYRLTADAGLDSLCHALEAYVSRKANPFTDPIALSCMRTIVENLPLACAEPGNKVAREAMMLAATQGGIAFSNASVTLIHGMSRPIGAHFHVPHGLSNAMLLPEVTAWSVSGAPARYADCARAMAYAETSDSDQVAIEKLVAGLRQLCAELKVPSPGEFGIDENRWKELMPLMAEQALASGSPANNPRIPEKEEIIALYEKVWVA